MKELVTKVLLVVVYFFVFLHAIDWISRGVTGPLGFVLPMICIAAAFIASVGLAEYTIKKLRKL